MTSEWNGVCVCGKRERDGVRCKYGASHAVLTIKPRVPRERLDDDDELPLFRDRPPITRERL